MTRTPTPEEWTQIREQFDTLIALPDELRVTRLLQARGGPFVITELRAMLDAERGDGPLDQTLHLGQDGSPIEYASLEAGAIVGVFRIERLIGRGGMGEVYLAHREAAGFAQRVALKMLRPEAIARAAMFDRERQLLAGLEHPGIARLIDGGLSPDGRPYMALEYVEGEAITAWCAAQRVDLSSRLGLFTDLCEAVEFAHARLVLHLDIKPSNVLVDREGRVRLLDFGVARIVEVAALDRTMTQALLTPDYAAPEQFAGGMPTVATDVYALGTLLFELLAGRGPWRFDDAPLPTVLRRLLHDDPPYPSRVAVGGGLPAAKLTGDLDAIVMKAMRRDPADRYANVAALAADVRRHLTFVPVKARAGTNGYRLNRFLRRNRWTATASAAALLLLLAGTGGIAWQARETVIERDIARAEARKAEAVKATVVLMFRNAKDFGEGGSSTARDLLNNSAKRLVEAHEERSPEAFAVVRTVAELYAEIGDLVGAETLLDRALAKGVGRGDPVATASLQMDLATVKTSTGDVTAAKALLDRSAPVWAADPKRFRRERLEAIASRAQLLRTTGSAAAGIELLMNSLPEAEQAYAAEPRMLLIRYHNLAVHLVTADRLAEANAVLKRAEAAVVRLNQRGSSTALSLLQIRGGWYSRMDNQPAALRTFQQAADQRRALFGPSTQLAADLVQVGLVSAGLGDFAQAATALGEARALALRYSGADSQVTHRAIIALAGVQARQGDIEDARTALTAVEPGVAKQGRTGLFYGIFLRARFELALAERRFADAKSDLDTAEAIFRATGPTAAPFLKSVGTLRERLTAARATMPA